METISTVPVIPTIPGDVQTITIPNPPRPGGSLAHYTAIIADHIHSQTAWQKITSRYDVSQMNGPEVVRFAHDLVSVGVDLTDALAVTWPISSRNLMEKIGRTEKAPRIDSWDDVVHHHIAEREIAKNRHNFSRVAHLDRLIRLARNFKEPIALDDSTLAS